MKKKHKEVAIKIGTKRLKSMCLRKKKYNEYQVLVFAAINKQRGYKCPICKNYHLTSNLGESK